MFSGEHVHSLPHGDIRVGKGVGKMRLNTCGRLTKNSSPTSPRTLHHLSPHIRTHLFSVWISHDIVEISVPFIHPRFITNILYIHS